MAKSSDKLSRQMAARGWTEVQIRQAVSSGEPFPTINRQTGRAATRYVHPTTGRSVVIDDASGEVIHVGGDGFIYGLD